MIETSRSHDLFQRAKELMPGGVNSPARAFGAVGGEPIFIERGEGPYLFDVDGNRYIDYIGSWGPMILGHAHPAVILAIRTAVDRGTSYGAPTERENLLAEAIIQAVPSDRKGAVGEFGHRSDDERDSAGSRLYGAGQDREVHGQLSRARG